MKKIYFLFLISFLFSSSIIHYFPAVYEEENGGLIKINISMENGTGEFVELKTKFGISTQESFEKAVEYAKIFSNFTEKKRFILSCNSNVKSIDGPSGGALFTTMLIALIKNKSIREDAIMSGTIEENGHIGQVGGLYEKALASKKYFKYFLVPKQSLFDRILLKKINGIKIIEIENISQAVDFFIYNKTINETNSNYNIEKIKNITPSEWESKKFLNIANEFIKLQNKEIEKNKDIINEENLSSYINTTTENEKILIKNNYFFSAANSAFLNYVDLKTISFSKNIDLNETKNKIKNCLNYKIPNIGKENLEWVAGAEIRKGWANEKLDIPLKGTKDEKIYYLHELAYADAWCHVGQLLVKNINDDNYNEESLKELAEEYKNKINKNKVDGDLIRHYKNGLYLYENKNYSGAIFEFIYVDTMSKDFENYTSIYESLKEKKLNYEWPNAYKTHAIYIAEQNKNYKTAAKLMLYANELEEGIKKMKTNLEKKPKKLDWWEWFISGFFIGVIGIKVFDIIRNK